LNNSGYLKKTGPAIAAIRSKRVSKEKAQSDPLVKSLKSKIRETNVRIAAVGEFVQLNQALAQAKVQKLAEQAAKKEGKSEPAQEAKRLSRNLKRRKPRLIKKQRNNR